MTLGDDGVGGKLVNVKKCGASFLNFCVVLFIYDEN
jgi:hypothetical protein